MAAVAHLPERRAEPRWTPVDLAWRTEAVLRPGQAVLLVNVSRHGALVESRVRLRPGAVTELHATAGQDRMAIRGRLDRCFVAALEPLRYRGVLVFEHRLALETRTA